MFKLLRHSVAVLTIAALTSFSARAQDATSSVFRPNAAWTATDGGVSTSSTGPDSALETRMALADSVTAFEFRAPVGAKATIYIQGRYAIDLPGNGDWQPFSLRFRAPRFDEGFKKSENALALEIHVGSQ